MIIPTKNRAHFLDLAVRSVLNQTFEDFEILVVDAASLDSTREVMREFDDKRIRFIHEERDPGVSATRNIGISLSKGKFIAFLDDDDLWLPRKLERQLKPINGNPAVGGVYSGAWIIDENGKIMGPPWIPAEKLSDFPDMLKRNYVGNCSGVLVRKECFERVGLFDETLPAAEDYDMWVRLVRHYEFVCLDEPLFFYRVHKKRISTNPRAKLQAGKIIFKKISTDLQALDNHREIIGYWRYEFGKLYCECGDAKQGRKEFMKAILNNPHSAIYYVRFFTSLFGSQAYNTLCRPLGFVLPLYLQFELA